jgi:hypothetical protein
MEQLTDIVNSVSKVANDVGDTISSATNDFVESVSDTMSDATSAVTPLQSTPDVDAPKPPPTDRPTVSYKDAVDKFFEYKSLYETKYTSWKKKQRGKSSGNGTLTRPKKQYNPKCLVCKGSGGMIFEMTKKKLTARCNSSPKTCGFHIEIDRLSVASVEDLIPEYTENQNVDKNAIIFFKNRMVFYDYVPSAADDLENNERIEFISQINEELKYLMNQKMVAIFGSTEELAKYEMLREQQKAILVEMQRSLDKISKDDPVSIYHDVVETYNSRLLPVVEDLRTYRDRYRFLPATMLSDPSKERMCPYEPRMMEIDRYTFAYPDFKDRVNIYRLSR